MADTRLTSLSNYLGTLLVLCALAACGTSEQHVVGWLGQDVRLPCDFTQPDVVALYWTNSSGTTKTVLFKQQRRSFDERFTLNEDFSLVIEDLRVSDEGRYSCRVELDSGESFINHTKLAIYASTSTPHIEQCVRASRGNESQSFCTVEVSNTHLFNLDCRVTGFRPNVTVEWTSSGIVKQPLGKPFQRTLPDGTYERVVTISVTAKLDKEQTYTCTVKGEATKGADRSGTVTVLAPGNGVPTWVKVTFGAVGGVLLTGFLVIIVVLCRPGTDGVLEALRREIKKYTFKISGEKNTAAHIGVFGESGAGKSSFINSLEVALKGNQSQTTGDIERATGGHTQIRSCLKLTDHISLSLNEIDREEEEASQFARLLDEEIHCPVFVYKYSDVGKTEAIEFLRKFSTTLRKRRGYLPMMVVTHADSLSANTKKELRESFSTSCKRVWFFENYTNSVESRAKSIKFLKFLKAALHHCDVAIKRMT